MGDERLDRAPTVVLERDSATTAVQETIAEEVEPLSEIESFEPGDRVGRYVIATRIGAGGMGVVYSAYDPQLDRKVAIKVLRPAGSGSSDGEDGKARLLREAQAMAKLSHPNVVAVYDVGLHAGRVWIAMELIEGQTLGDWLAAGERGRAQVVEVFVQAGRGLAAAHQAGLVHRDFKPDNVLVDRGGRARVMDFGLVRASRRYASWTPDGLPTAGWPTETVDALDSPLTRDGVVVGTPSYMSPEQHLGREPTAASDQYGFCAALYEGLHGQRPFRGKDLRALALAKARMQFETLPASAPHVSEELHGVLVRGLQPHAAARFANMEALLAALERHAVRQPRRRWTWASIGVVAAAGVGWSLSAWPLTDRCDPDSKLDGVWDSTRAEDVRVSMSDAHPDLPDAVASRVEGQLDAYAAAWSRSYVQTCRSDREAVQMDLRMRCLEQRRAALRTVVDQLGRAHEVRLDRLVPMVLGLPAVRSCDQVDPAEGAPLHDPELVARVDALRSELERASTLRRAGRYEEAREVVESLLEEVVELQHPPLEARVRLARGDLMRYEGDVDGAERETKQAFWLASSAADDQTMASAATSLVFSLAEDRADTEAALEWARHADAALQRWGDQESFDFRWAQSDLEGSKAVVYSSDGRYAEALEHFERSHAVKRELFGDDHPVAAGALMNTGICLVNMGRPREARERLERSLDGFTRALGEQHPDLALNLRHLGSVESELGNEARAQELYEGALAAYRSAYGEKHPEVASLLDALGISEGVQGRLTTAMAYHQRALAIFEEVLGPEHPEVGRVLLNMGQAAGGQRQLEEARRHFERARGILLSTLGPDHNLAIAAGAELGLVLADLERFDEAEALLEQSVRAQRRSVGEEHPYVADALGSLGWVYSEQERFDDAKKTHQQALRIYEKTYGAEHQAVLTARFDVAMMDFRLGRPQSAVEQMRAVLAGLEGKPVDPALIADIRFHLAEAMVESGQDVRQAVTLAEQAREGFVLAGQMKADELPDVEAFLSQHSR